MSKICVNKHVFWSRNETKLSGKVKSVMSDHVLVVTPDGTQHIVSTSVLSTKPIDKLALLACASMTKTAASSGQYSEQELQDFLVGLHIEMDLKTGKVTVEAVDADGAPAEEHSKLLGNALDAIIGGKGVVRLTDDALERKQEEAAIPEKETPLSGLGTMIDTPPSSAPPPPPPPPPGKTKIQPQRLGPIGT